ncbi:MAG: PepSY domain-containing protein [Defluviitaleaceae bacterium]|nr:PepSY domain-containing protein [Defluviitaleaceae bacterium]
MINLNSKKLKLGLLISVPVLFFLILALILAFYIQINVRLSLIQTANPFIPHITMGEAISIVNREFFIPDGFSDAILIMEDGMLLYDVSIRNSEGILMYTVPVNAVTGEMHRLYVHGSDRFRPIPTH